MTFKRSFTEKQQAAIIELYVRGIPTKEIAAKFGCNPSYPRRLAKVRGIESRSPEAQRSAISEGRARYYANKRAEQEQMNTMVHEARKLKIMMDLAMEREAENRRSFTSVIMGDPLPGRSALDQKRAAECQ